MSGDVADGRGQVGRAPQRGGPCLEPEARRERVRMRAAAVIMVVLGTIGTHGCQGSGTEVGRTLTAPETGQSPAMPPMGVTPPTEIHGGMLDPHEVAEYTFATASGGLADIRVGATVNVPPPARPLFLTLRHGSCPDQCGDVVADSSNGSLAVGLAAGSYSVSVGNPNDQPLGFTLVMNYPR